MRTRPRFLPFALPIAALAIAPPGICWDGDKPSIVLNVPQADGTLSWEGKPGRTYFVQHSDDLRIWLYREDIWSGDGGPEADGFDCSGPRLFVRLRFSDIPTANPALADFDLDGASNSQELVELGTDPLDPDTDGDGLADDEDLEPLLPEAAPLTSDTLIVWTPLDD